MTGQREVMEYDVVIVGAGPAGLSAAIRLKQISKDINVCILEKGSETGAHILSGAAFDPIALNELLPDWKERGAPLAVETTEDAFYFLTPSRALRLPLPKQMQNHGNYIISLANLCRWLGAQAESLGVQIFAGFPAAEAWIEDGRLQGVITGEFGRARDGSEKPGFQPGVMIKGKYTLLAEGCRGSIAEHIMRQFDLRDESDPQTYGIGIKEIWEIDPAMHRKGRIMHSVGWPLNSRTYGGSFVYHAEHSQLYLGMVIGLDYENPWLDPFEEFQRFKTHPLMRQILAGGKRVAYGARALNEGGLQSLPTLIFPGGALIGDAAGFLNVPRIKGSHLAMKTGMLAAEAVAGALKQEAPPLLPAYPEAFRTSWAHAELYRARNTRPAFRHGLWAGMLHAALDSFLFRGHAPWTLHHRTPDHATLKPASAMPEIAYPKPDGVLTFDRLSSVYLSNTNHAENQPVHLTLKDASIPVAYNLPVFAAPEQRYCPAGVYEIVERDGAATLQINAQNCVHCKTCDIKDPKQNIVWVTPEGGGGPNYGAM